MCDYGCDDNYGVDLGFSWVFSCFLLIFYCIVAKIKNQPRSYRYSLLHFLWCSQHESAGWVSS